MKFPWPALIIICCTFRSPSDAQADAHQYYFKEKRPLVEMGNQIAVLRTAAWEAPDTTATTTNLARTIRGLGVNANALRRHAVRGWWLGQASGTSTRGASATMRDVVTSATFDPQIEFVSPVFKGNDGGAMFVTPTLLVRFEKGVSVDRAEAILTSVGAGTILERNWGGMAGAYKIQAGNLRSGYAVLDVANQLAVMPEVRFAEPNMVFTGHSDVIPNDTGFGDCWGLNNTGQLGGVSDQDMDAPEAWNITQGSASIKVLVLESGVEQTHPDINQLPGHDVTNDTSGGMGGPINAYEKHGTAVAGCISATINNSLGTVGIAPGCKVLSVRTFIGKSAGGWTTNIIWTVEALEWGALQGARVSNNSNGYGFTSASIDDKYQDTYDGGMVHFAAAGNGTTNTLGYPASIPVVNAVASLTRTGVRAASSQYGDGLDFSAPGVSIYTTDRTGSAGYTTSDYAYVSGTSFASPYAAGVAALILSHRPTLTSLQVEQIMADSCVDKGAAGYDTGFGWGLVNAHGALLLTASAAVGEWELY